MYTKVYLKLTRIEVPYLSLFVSVKLGIQAEIL